ncbi:MAG: serine hydrolase [Bacteroidota bacterium]|jgi:beta-lactamase class A
MIALIALSMHSEPNGRRDISRLDTNIQTVLSQFKGDFGIAFKSLSDSTEYYFHERVVFHAASTMKTPVMLEVFNQAEQKKLSLDDSLLVENKFRSIVDGSDFSLEITDDSGDRLYGKIGRKESIRTLVFEMITVSSNFATNLLIEKVGAENVMHTLERYHISGISVLRGVEDTKAFEAGKNNTATPLGLLQLFDLIASDNSISVLAKQEMISILLQQKFNSMIPALLPQTVKVAHKTGSITNVQHDSGIVFLPDGRKYVLVVLSKNLKSNAEGQKAIAEISKLIYDFMVN